MVHFPEYAKVLPDNCFEDTNDNVTGCSKQNKIKCSNIIHLKFPEEKQEVMFDKCKYDSEWQCCDFWAESVCTWKAANDRSSSLQCNKYKYKNPIWITPAKEKYFAIPLTK